MLNTIRLLLTGLILSTMNTVMLADEAANKKYKGKHNKHWRARTAETLPPPGTATWRGPDRMKLEGHYPGDGHDHSPEDFLLPEGFADG